MLSPGSGSIRTSEREGFVSEPRLGIVWDDERRLLVVVVVVVVVAGL